MIKFLDEGASIIANVNKNYNFTARELWEGDSGERKGKTTDSRMITRVSYCFEPDDWASRNKYFKCQL